VVDFLGGKAILYWIHAANPITAPVETGAGLAVIGEVIK
jgi:hypothetical protein